MNVELILKVNGREVAQINDVIPTQAALPLENRIEDLKNRAGQVLVELGCQELAASLRHPCCCGRPMENRGLSPSPPDPHQATDAPALQPPIPPVIGVEAPRPASL